MPLLCTLFVPLLLLTLTTPTARASSTAPLPCTHDATTFRCVKYVSNYDADTIKFDIPHVHPLLGHEISVRVRGLDAPEMKGKNACEKTKAKEAKAFVASIFQHAKRIDLVNAGKDKYFRILADVEVDGVSLTDALLHRGYAYTYLGKTKQKVDWCGIGSAGTRVPAGGRKREIRQ